MFPLPSLVFARLVLLGCWIAIVAVPPHAAAQSSPWALDAGRDRVSVTNAGTDAIWTTDRVQVSWVRPERGGVFGAVERHERSAVVNVTAGVRGYRRLGDWTVVAGAGATPDAVFLYRYSVEGEVARRVVGTIVAGVGYRHLAFQTQTIRQWQPSLTWYHARGDVGARYFVTRNATTGRTSPTVQLRTTVDLTPRLRVGGGLAIGDRIFDVSLLPAGDARSRVGFGSVRVGLTTHDFVELGASYAREEPSFLYRSVSVGYRRTF